MSKVAVGLGVVVALTGGAALFIQQQSIAELRGEIALLRRDANEVAAQRAKVASAAKRAATDVPEPKVAGRGADSAEVAKLREEVDGLKKAAQEFGKVLQAAQAKQAESSIPTKLVPLAEWKNSGRATAASAMETVLWAAAGGEVDTLAQGIVFTPTAQAKANAWFAQLSDATKAQYGSPEKLVALMIAKDAANLSGMQILGQREITPDDVGLRIRVGGEDGKTKDDSFLLHRQPDGWRLTLPDQVVEKFAKQLANGGK